MAPAIPFIVAGLGALGAMSQAHSASVNAQNQANASKYNALVNQQQAVAAVNVASQDEQAQRRQSAIILGRQKAAINEAGIGLDGSGGDVFQQSAQNAELDALNIRYGGQLKANAFNSQSNMDLYAADTQKQNAKSIQQSGYLNAGASALSGYSGAKYSASKVA